MVSEDSYKNEVDFTALALQYPEFSKKLKANRQLDFSDPDSIRQLTKALLHRDFGLSIDLPDDRLCPPVCAEKVEYERKHFDRVRQVPNRFNYILFVQRLIDSTRLDYDSDPDLSESSIGLDIGTGASAIYPLLACRQRSTWAFLTTEIDPQSRAYAERNICTNQLQSRVKMLDTDPTGSKLIPSSGLERFDNHAIRVQIVNPPFYASEEDMLQSAKRKSRPPNSACTGAPVEMITKGGEVQFVSQLIEESRLPQNQSKIQWFSSMLGKSSSLGEVVERLRRVDCSNYAVTEFVQGEKTRRWCVAWSWLSIRPPVSIARGTNALDKKFLPFPSEFEFLVGGTLSATGLAISTSISKLDLDWKPSPRQHGGIGRSITGDVWSRKARRRQQRDAEMKDISEGKSDSSEDEQEPKFAFGITIGSVPGSKSGTPQTQVHIRWLQGQDAVLFESFCGWLKGKITA